MMILHAIHLNVSRERERPEKLAALAGFLRSLTLPAPRRNCLIAARVKYYFGMLFVAWVVAGLGCSRGPSVVPVTGTVTFQGKPLEGANVTFVSTGETKTSWIGMGVTDAAGKFALQTSMGPKSWKGLVPGDYLVTISKTVPPDGLSEEAFQKKVEEASRPDQVYNPNMAVPSRVQLLPPEYIDGTKSPLKVKVQPSGAQDFPLQIP